MYIIVVINLCFPVPTGILWMVLWCFVPPLFCLIKPQLVEADGHPSWVWFCQRFLPVKRESFLSTVATGTLRTGDWTEDNFRCNLLVSLDRMFFLNWLYMNELDYFVSRPRDTDAGSVQECLFHNSRFEDLHTEQIKRLWNTWALLSKYVWGRVQLWKINKQNSLHSRRKTKGCEQLQM